MSHAVEKIKRGDSLEFINIHSVEKYQKTGHDEGTFLKHLKTFEKKSHSAEKNLQEGPFSLV